MSRLISKFAVLAIVVVGLVFFTFHTLRSPPTPSFDPGTIARLDDDGLQGAAQQTPAQAPPLKFEVSEKIVSDPGPAVPTQHSVVDEEQAKKEKQKQEAERQKQEEEKKKHREAEHAKSLIAYKKIKVITGTFEVPKDMVHDPAGPKPHEIVLLAASDGKGHNGGIKNILGDITPNRQEYADFHGYAYQFLNISKYQIGNAHAVWAKLPAIVETFNLHPQAKWLWWLDLDAIIMTPEVELRTHLLSHDALGKKILRGFELNRSGGGKSGLVTAENPDLSKIDLILTQDQNGLNAGSFFIRRSEFSRMFIDMWADPLYVRENFIAQEQDAMMHLVREHPVVQEHFALVTQTEMNAYPVKNVPGMAWEPGHLVVHIAGCWVENRCNSQWKEYMALRTPVPKHDIPAAATAMPAAATAVPAA